MLATGLKNSTSMACGSRCGTARLDEQTFHLPSSRWGAVWYALLDTNTAHGVPESHPAIAARGQTLRPPLSLLVLHSPRRAIG
jgi:hypothetical protein